MQATPHSDDNPSDIEKNFAALHEMRKARIAFETVVGEASLSRDPDVLEELQREKLFELAEFYYAMAAMGIREPDDILILVRLHNHRIADMIAKKRARKAAAMPSLEQPSAARKSEDDPLLWAMFTMDVLPRLEKTWRENPGALDQSNLARFLALQMSKEKLRDLVVAAEAAGFLNRVARRTYTVVMSTGVLEHILDRCMRDMRLAIASL